MEDENVSPTYVGMNRFAFVSRISAHSKPHIRGDEPVNS